MNCYPSLSVMILYCFSSRVVFLPEYLSSLLPSPKKQLIKSPRSLLSVHSLNPCYNDSGLPQRRLHSPPHILPPRPRPRHPPHRSPWHQQICRLALHDHLHPRPRPLRLLRPCHHQSAPQRVPLHWLHGPYRRRRLASRAGGFLVFFFFFFFFFFFLSFKQIPGLNKKEKKGFRRRIYTG